jgi:epoxyqueuosine reductase
MQYMSRPANLFVNTNNFLKDAKSIISVVINYSAKKVDDICPKGYGRVARYAWGKDYHVVLKNKLEELAKLIKDNINYKVEYKTFTDAVPLLERAFARKNGLGFIGKNTMLIKPKLGSFFFIGEILLNLEIEHNALKIVKENCGTCNNCISSCPTNAIVNPFQVDARKCISYLTIEKKTWLDETEQAMLGSWIFGCDICQEVCPFNHTSMKNKDEGYHEFLNNPVIENGLIDLNFILSIKNDVEFKKIFIDTAILRTKRSGLIRNALTVAANTNCIELFKEVVQIAREEKNLVIRKQAYSTLFSFAKLCDSKERRSVFSIFEKNIKIEEGHIQQYIINCIDRLGLLC